MSHHEQLEAYLAGRLPADERECFEEELARNPQLLDELLAQEKIDAALRMLLGNSERERVLAAVAAVIRNEAASTVKDEVLREVRLDLGRKKRRANGRNTWPQHPAAMWSAGLAAAALVLLGLFIIKHSGSVSPFAPVGPINPVVKDIPTPPQIEDTGIAEMTELRGRIIVFRNGSEMNAFDRFALQSGDEVRSDAGGVIRIKDGTRVILESGSVIRLGGEEGKNMELVEGRVSAEVAKQKAGKHVVIRTPLAMITVHGTAFSLEAKPSTTRLDVSEGWVRMAHTQSESELELTGGEFALAMPDRELLGGLQPVAVTTQSPANDVGERDPVLWPFASTSPWNTAIGSNAIYAPVQSPSLDLAGRGLAVLPAGHHRAIFLSNSQDPMTTVWRRYGGGEWMRLRLAPDLLDNFSRPMNSIIIDPQTGLAHELIQAVNAGGRLEAMLGQTHSLRGSGMPPEQSGHSHSGIPLFAGVIRKGEMERGIRHALAANVIHHGLSRAGSDGRPFVWPARHVPMEIRKIEAMAPSGNVHFGTLLAIPPDVDLTKIGVGASGPAFEVARALQDYGAYVTHSYERAPNDGKGWQQPHMQLFADGISASELREIYGAVSKLAGHLRVVTNNTPNTIGGGGQPRRVAPPNPQPLAE